MHKNRNSQHLRRSQQSGMDIQGIKTYLLGPGDVVEIRVFGQPDLNSTAQVDGDGNLIHYHFSRPHSRQVSQ